MNKNSVDVDVYSTSTITREGADELINSEDVKAISMYNGKFLLVIDIPSKFEILNFEDASRTPFVIATSIRGFGEQTHYVYFIDPEDVNTPTMYNGCYSLKDCVKDKVLSLIDKLYPAVGIYDIDAKHIPLERDENEKIINAEESIHSPLIGLFLIPLAEGNFYENCGIKLFRMID